MQLAQQFSAISGLSSIDRAAGVIKGVSVITIGEARGHGLYIDKTTLEQVMATARAYPNGLKVKVDHGGGLFSIAGALRDFVMDGNHLRANLHLLENEEEREKVLEMAEKMPESFGVSISFSNRPEEIDGKKFARCAEIYSADLVDGPAANPTGLFSQPQTNKDTSNKPMSDPNANGPTLADLAATVAELKKGLEAIKPTDLSTVTADITAAKTELAKLTKAAADAAEAAKKTEIAALVAEASRDGKVVPLTDAQLAKMDVADIKEMIAKLPKSQVQLARKPAAPTDKDGKEITLDSKDVREFCHTRRAEGADALTALIRGQMEHN